MMISILTILSIAVAFIITTILPIVLAIFIAIKWKGNKVVVPMLLGAAGFVIPQMFIRIPILSAISTNEDFTRFVSDNFVFYCLILAFTAGLFELAGRYAVAKILSKNLSYERSISAGFGHGAIESILIVGSTYAIYIVFSMLINTGNFDSFTQSITEQLIAGGQDPTAITGIKDQMINTNPVMFLLGCYERILTVVIHIALSLIVCYFVSKKQDIIGIIICLVLHTTLDFLGGFIKGLSTSYLGNVISENTSYIIIYCFLTIFAIAMLITIFKIRKSWAKNTIDKI